jgi:hypothetical protein
MASWLDTLKGVTGTAVKFAGTALKASGEARTAYAYKAQGDAIMAAREFEADELRASGLSDEASSQRVASEQRRTAKRVGSDLIAKAAMTGGASDPSVIKAAADIAGEGEYRALVAMYQGQTSRAGKESAATIKEFEGQQAQYIGREKKAAMLTRSKVTALSAIAGPSLYSKYASS